MSQLLSFAQDQENVGKMNVLRRGDGAEIYLKEVSISAIGGG